MRMVSAAVGSLDRAMTDLPFDKTMRLGSVVVEVVIAMSVSGVLDHEF